MATPEREENKTTATHIRSHRYFKNTEEVCRIVASNVSPSGFVRDRKILKKFCTLTVASLVTWKQTGKLCGRDRIQRQHNVWSNRSKVKLMHVHEGEHLLKYLALASIGKIRLDTSSHWWCVSATHSSGVDIWAKLGGRSLDTCALTKRKQEITQLSDAI